MGGLKAFLTGNTLLIAAAMAVAAAAAVFAGLPSLGCVFGMLCGMALMWIARPAHPEDDVD